jgi:hypothetical protein
MTWGKSLLNYTKCDYSMNMRFIEWVNNPKHLSCVTEALVKLYTLYKYENIISKLN